jgi:AmmeMemoRadiSam system protein B
MNAVRAPAVAGAFYPGTFDALQSQLLAMLASAGTADARRPKALIAPHAGYIYSGPVAASAYAHLAPHRHNYSRVVLLGPAHRVRLRGLALPASTSFATPLGEIPLDRDAVAALRGLPQVCVSDEAHDLEHSLEVHLPFLQQSLSGFTLVPLAVGDASVQEVTQVLDLLWGGEETLIVVSSDLSHYLAYPQARHVDEQTAREVERCLNCDMQTVFIDRLCIECDACVDICPMDCISFTENGEEADLRARLKAPSPHLDQDLYVADGLKTGRVMVKDEDVCLHCGLCAERCPTGAWDMQKYLIDMTHAGSSCQSKSRSAA